MSSAQLCRNMLLHLTQKSVFFLIFFYLTKVVADGASSNDDTFSGGLQGLEIAPKVITNVPYGNSRLSVWGHLDNLNRTPDKKEYFVMPVVMLLSKTASCQSNVFTGQTSLQFKLVMWDEDVASASLTHLRKSEGNPQLQSYQITTLPMEQLRLVWANSAQHLSEQFVLNTEWQSYANQDNNLGFEIVVSSNDLCLQALGQLEQKPDSLRSLELQYVLHGTKASRKKITVTGQHLLQGKMYAKMRNKVDPNGNIYLTSHDLNSFSQEAISNVVANVMTDADYVDTGDSISLSKLVYDSLSTFKQSTATMTPEMWKSTFWQDEYARPDKLNSFLNKVITKDQGQNHTVHVNDNELHNSGSTSASVNVFHLFGGSGSLSGQHMTKSHVSEDELRAWLKEYNYDVEWTGEVFKIKSMDLYRLNTQELNQKQNIATTYIQIHQVQYTYNVQVSFPGDSASGTTVPTAALNQRLDAVETAIKKEITDRTAAENAAQAKTAALQTKQDQDNKNINKRTDGITSTVNANTAKLTPLQILRGKTTCTYFDQRSGPRYDCPANYKIAFCACYEPGGDIRTLHGQTVNGPTCTCGSGGCRPHGACCLGVG